MYHLLNVLETSGDEISLVST
uniref:Uncharacterized protein n=1 Tax=Arundo donax TaxID=35708 RepID=A0A0A8YF00_ARUDO